MTGITRAQETTDRTRGWDEEPVMLFYAPHRAHEEMAEAIGAELVASVRGGPLARIREARRLDIGDRPIITEGGQPQFQAAWMKIFGNCGPVFHLAADASLVHMHNPLPNYELKDRLAHRWAHRHVDGVLAVSPRLAAMAHARDIPAKLVHPFAETWKYEGLVEAEPDLESDTVLAVGHNKPANNFGMLADIERAVDSDLAFDVIGPDTEELSFESDAITTHGFVEKDEFVAFFERSEALVLPAPFQAFPVSVIESLHAGLPPVISDYVGTAAYVSKVHPRLVQEKDAEAFARALDWYHDLPLADKRTLSDRTREMGTFFERERGLAAFVEGYDQLLARVDGGT
jgi:glycosyltransferase involved in cell wall biosynthesis